MTPGEEMPDEGPAIGGGHDRADNIGALGIVDRGLLFLATDGLAICGVVGH